MSIISRLAVVLGLDSAQFNSGLAQASTKTKEFQTTAMGMKAGVVAAGAALVAASYQAIQYADGINDIAKANEMSVGTVLEFSQALTVSGGKAESASRLIASFTNKVDEAAQGSDKTRDKFKELGISLKDLGNLSEEELLRKTVRGLAAIPDEIHRNAMAFDLLGKAVRGVDIKGLAKELEQINGTMDGSDKAFAKIGDSLDRIDRLALQMKTDMANNLSEPFAIATTAAENFYKFLKEKNDELKTGTGGFGALDIAAPWLAGIKAYSKAGKALLAMREESLAAKNSTHYTPMKDGDYTPSILKGGGPSPKRLLAEGEEAKKIREKLEADQKRLGETLKSQLATLKLQTSEVSGQKSEYEKLVIKFAETEDIDNKHTKNLKNQILAQAQQYDLAVKTKEENQILYDLAVARTKEMQADLEAQRQFKLSVDDIKIAAERLNYQKQLGKLSTTQTEKALAYYDLQQNIVRMSKDEVNMSESQKKVLQEQIALLTEAEQKRIEAADDLARYQRTAQAGWDKAYADFVESSTDSAAMAANAFNSMAGSMTSALDGFVESGKLSFGSLIESMIKDLIKLMLKSQVTGFFNMFGGGGGDIGLFSSSTNFANGGGLAGFFGFADGGSPPVGVPSLVGERGPELFIPKTAGTVIPNNQLSSAMGKQPQNVYNGPYIANMQTIDSKSFQERIYESSSAVWAANQYANKSLAVNGGKA